MSGIARRGLCLVLSAPSGAGKSAITDALMAREPGLRRSISATTRQPRPGERDGVHYHFVTDADFARMDRNGELLESAHVLAGTHAYGTPRAPVAAAMAAGEDMIFDIDWQGFQSMRARLAGDVVGVFILPPDFVTLEKRLRKRAGDAPEEIARRMTTARAEISHWPEFDHVIVNDRLEDAIESVAAILRTARLTTARQTGLAAFIAGMGV